MLRHLFWLWVLPLHFVAVLGSYSELHGAPAGTAPPREVEKQGSVKGAFEGAAFSIPPDELLKVAAAMVAPEDAPVVRLLRDIRVSLDAQGRSVTTWRNIYLVRKPAGIEGVHELLAEWSPWFEQRPAIRARIISPQGEVSWLAPATLSERPVVTSEPGVSSDRRQLGAPVPGLRVGSVLEEEICIREHTPMFDKGVTRRVVLSSDALTSMARFALEYPTALPVSYKAHNLGRAPRIEQTATGQRLTFEHLGNLRDTSRPGPSTTSAKRVFVSYSTGRSWAEVARRYSAAVEAVLAGAQPTKVDSLVGAARTRVEIAEKLLMYLHSEVRYTGLELGEAAILPQPPQETLRRRFGDCKDQATLLVHLLRQAGVDAHVALLSAGHGIDVDEELAGLGLFNHAIVYVPKTPGLAGVDGQELWIDPTEEMARLGQLPSTDRGRLALIARPETRALLPIPAAPMGDAWLKEERRIVLSELGPSRITESIEAGGTAEIDFRRTYKRLGDAANQREAYTRYGQAEYGAKELARFDAQEPQDLHHPFRMRLEFAGATRGYTEELDALVRIPLGGLLDELPPILLHMPDKGVADDVDIAQLPSLDFEPTRKTWLYVIEPPAGFTAAEVPPSREYRLGAAVLHQEFVTLPNQQVQGTLRFDPGSGHLTPSELATMRSAIRELLNGESLLVRFTNTGRTLLEAGHTKEAIDEFRRLMSLHPGEAMHRSHLALALLSASLGTRARAVAREAVAREPSSGYAHRILGYVLLHDAWGHQFQRGWDREGALSAFRQAKQLDPEDVDARFNLALAQEYTEEGDRYTDDRELAKAIAEYQALRTTVAATNATRNLIPALVYAKRGAELRTLVGELAPDGYRDIALVISTALLEGAEVAVQTSRSRIAAGAAQSKALEAAAVYLVALRRYPQAALLVEAAVDGAQEPLTLRKRAAYLRQLRPFEQTLASNDSPKGLAQRLLLMYMSEDYGEAALAAVLSPDMLATVKQEAQAGMLKEISFRAAARKQGLPLEFFLDCLFINQELHVEGDESTGYLVRATSAMAGQPELLVFITRTPVGLRVQTLTGGQPNLGREVLRRLDRGDTRGAYQWLDWMRTMPQSKDEDGLYAALWPALAGRSEVIARGAAAALVCAWNTASSCAEPARVQAVVAIQKARDQAAEPRASYELVLGTIARSAGQARELLEVANRLAAVAKDSTPAFVFRIQALTTLGNQLELERVLGERFALKGPDDKLALLSQAGSAADRGQTAASVALYRRLKELHGTDPIVLNDLAWTQVFLSPVPAEAVADAEHAVALTDRKRLSALHTLATVYTAIGRFDQAREIVTEILNQRLPAPEDHYLLGRLAEHYGELQAAQAEYAQVPAPDGPNHATATYELVQGRLRGLQGFATRRRADRK